jgi:TolB-like protein
MADVFVSYARPDALLAQRIAESLKSAGYEVWWDSELLPHHAFAASIEEEIRAARAVVVVWSRQAVASQWVRAEADLARSENKLVQVSIDQCALPLPFNQYQAADLQSWKGDPSDLRWTKVVASVAQLTQRAAEASASPPRSFRAVSWTGGPAWLWALVALAACVVLVGGGLWLARSVFQPPARGSRIAVRPYETIGGTAAMHDFAAGLSESLQDTLNQDKLPTVSSSDARTLEGPDLPARLKALDVGLVLSGAVQADGPTVTVRTRLEDPLHHATLWTADVSGSTSQLQPLQAQVGARTVAVLGCSAQALNRKSGIAEPDVLALFLHACDLAETSHHGSADDKIANAMLDAMREVARKAPDFAPAHSILAKHDAFLVDALAGQSAALRQEAEREATRALELDPKDPDGYVTRGLLAPHLDFGQREKWFRQAINVDPSWPHANGFLGNVMTDLGRLEEASALYQRAASVNPLSTDWSDQADFGLIWTGATKQADADMARFSQLWPGDVALWRHQLESLVAQHRWADALTRLNSPNANPQIEMIPKKRWRLELDALNTHGAAALSAARQMELDISADRPSVAINGLAFLGLVDDAFAVARRYQPVTPDGADDPAFLFGPEMAALRRDPRFMLLANKFGLPQYWRDTGKWPDFCADPGLPYNCQTEAAKQKPVLGLIPKAQ